MITRRPRGRLLKWMQHLCLAGGTAVVVWCAFILIDAAISQRLAHETLASLPGASSPPSPTAQPSLPQRSARPPTPAAGTPLAELSIPRIGLSAVVLQGTDNRTLRKGIGHVETTPLPGEAGNAAIAGHRDSFFRPLRNVVVGDDILLTTPGKQFHYRVSSVRIVDAGEVSVIGPTTDPALTLVTCYPFWFIGPAPDRFVVRAIRVEAPVTLVSTASATTKAIRQEQPRLQQRPASSVRAKGSAATRNKAAASRARRAAVGRPRSSEPTPDSTESPPKKPSLFRVALTRAAAIFR
jgi:sortase A